MRILVTGASGFIGSCLLEFLYSKGFDDLVVLTRDPAQFESANELPIAAYSWNPKENKIDTRALDGIDVVINLAGEGVAGGRWTTEKKQKILDSRIKGTQLLINHITSGTFRPKKFISVSAIGIYGDRNSEGLVEESSAGDGFLAEVCKQWEEAVCQASNKDTQISILRLGIVLGRKGGVLEKMLTPFKLGVGGVLGSGRQYMSWIHIADLMRIFMFFIEAEESSGVYNTVSPLSCTNREFIRTLGHVLQRPTVLPLPGLLLKLIFGEASELLLHSQRVVPQRLLREGFLFKFSSLEEALLDLCIKPCNSF